MMPALGNPLVMLVTLGIEEAPAIINAIHAKGGTVQNVGPILDADKAMIAGDLERLRAEQAEIDQRKKDAPGV